jgi:hypothetical protein
MSFLLSNSTRMPTYALAQLEFFLERIEFGVQINLYLGFDVEINKDSV